MSKGVESAHPAGRHLSCLGSHVYYNDGWSQMVRTLTRSTRKPCRKSGNRYAATPSHRLARLIAANGRRPTQSVTRDVKDDRGDRSAMTLIGG